MSLKDLIEMEGLVTESLPNTMFKYCSCSWNSIISSVEGKSFFVTPLSWSSPFLTVGVVLIAVGESITEKSSLGSSSDGVEAND